MKQIKKIKFRQPLKNGNYHYWGYINDCFICPAGDDIASGPSEQFINRYDINGEELYENDEIIVGCNKRVIQFYDDLVWDGDGSHVPGWYFNLEGPGMLNGELSFHDSFEDVKKC